MLEKTILKHSVSVYYTVYSSVLIPNIKLLKQLITNDYDLGTLDIY